MKKTFILMALCLHAGILSAERYKAAVINLQSGASVNYALEGVNITTEKGKVILNSDKAHAEWKLSEVASFEVKELEQEATGLADIVDFFVSFDAKNRTLKVNNYSGPLDLLLPGGQLYKSYEVKNSADIDLNLLQQSLYICHFRSNGQTLKIITK